MRLPIALLGLGAIATSVAAQVDYRNLDHGRPSLVEDAYPVERFGFDVSLGYTARGFAAGRTAHIIAPELVYGAGKGIQVALATPWAVSASGPARSTGLAGLDLSVLTNLSTETRRLPGLALRLDGSFGAGRAGGRGTGVELRGVATRSVGRHRLHLNAGISLRTPEDPGLRDEAGAWWLGVALDRTLIRTSTLLIGEATLTRAERDRPLVTIGGFGVRRQLAPTLVLDIGLHAEFQRSSRTTFSGTLGFSHAFGLRFLVPGGAP